MSLEDITKHLQQIDGDSQKKAPKSRARVREGGPEFTLETKKLPKVLRSLLDAISDDDVDQVVTVWREAMKAERSFWRETGKTEGGKSIGCWQTEPDHRTRLEASKLVAAYKEGLPVQRQVTISATAEELGSVIDRLKNSPAAQEMLLKLAKGTFQKTGREMKPADAREV